MKKIKVLSSLLATLMVLSMLATVPVSAATTNFEGPYNFDDVVTTSEGYRDPTHASASLENPVASDSYVVDILKSLNTDSYDGKSFLELYTVQSGEANSAHSNASGTVVVTRTNTKFYLLNNICATSGVETYEFDFLWSHTSSQDMVLECQETGTNLLPSAKINSKNNTTWKHMVIEYDTDADTLSVSIDGELINTLEGVTSFTQPLILSNQPKTGLGSRARFFRIDNYHSYVTTTGAVEEPEMTFTNFDIDKAATGTLAIGDAVNVTADVTSTYTSAQSVTVIYAFYFDNKLVAVGTNENVTIPAGSSEMSITFTTTQGGEYDAVKAFIWDGLTTMTPLTEAVSYPAE